MIRGLKLRNWKSHLESELDFGRGTNVLVGTMGSGKSSVLTAISFALFGTFPSHRSREVKLDDVIMRRPRKKQEAEVELEFEIGGDVFTVMRKVERGKGTTEANIRKDGELLDTGASRTTELVEKQLKVDYNLFSRAVYSEQDGLDNFLEIRRGERMKKIDNLLQIDRFEKCRSSVTTLINRLVDRVSSKKKTVEELEEQENFDRIEELEGEIKEMEDDLDGLKERLKKLEGDYDRTKKEIEGLREGMKKIKGLENKKSNLEGIISSLEEDIKSLKKKTEFSKKEVQKKLEEKKERLREIRENKKEVDGVLEELKDKQKEKRIKIGDLQKRIQKIKGVKGRCPVCDRNLDEEHRKELIDERREKINKMAVEKEEVEDEVKEKEERKEKLEGEIKGVEDEVKELEKVLESAEELEKKKKKLGGKIEEMENVRGILEEKREKFDRKKMEKKQEILNKLSGNKKETEEKIRNKKKLLEERNEEKNRLKKRKKRFEKYKNEIEQTEKSKEDLKKFRSALKTTQKQLRTRFIEAVNSTLSKVWSGLYPYDDFSDLRFTISEGDYELQFENKGNWQPVEGMASGGERTSACLALRIAFALVLAPNLKWLVLDEPTHNLDRHAVKDLSKLLGDEISEFVDQVFLITHNEIMEEAASGTLHRLEKDKKSDGPTKVMEIT